VYLESIEIFNFRKFGCKENSIKFVGLKTIDLLKENNSLISTSSTLIVGKNNSGKSTIAKALKFICSKSQPKASDFNFSYLRSIFKKYHDFLESGNEDIYSLPLPEIFFKIKIKTNMSVEDGDLLNDIGMFVSINTNSDLANINICYKFSERELLIDVIKKILTSEESEKKDFNSKFEEFYNFLNSEESKFKIIYENSTGQRVDNFDLNKVLKIKEIEANRYLKDGVLSDIFKKIVSFQVISNHEEKTGLQKSIDEINERITKAVFSKKDNISSILQEVEKLNHVNFSLNGNVNQDTILKDLVKYSFLDGEDFIPENQFGLGYINLLNIIGEIIHYIDSYEDESHKNQVNLLFIEEPEAFMHPQMQEFFMNRIDNAVKKALEVISLNRKNKKLICQTIVTTHSSHIVNSKILNSNSFNNINYLNASKMGTSVVNLEDDILIDGIDIKNSDELKFIRKHIKYKVSELFFSDAVVFVEGVTEETLLKFYIDQSDILSNYYISVFNINGAHGKVYFPLAKALRIPCLIVTDVDIKREKCEKGEKHNKTEDCNVCNQRAKTATTKFVSGSKSKYVQISSLENRLTTNSTIREFNKKINKKMM